VAQTEKEGAALIVMKTANTYRLATMLYAYSRMYRFTPDHPVVQNICTTLVSELCKLPASGDEYTGVHPAWCFVIAIAHTIVEEEYARMDMILQFIANRNKSNVSRLTTLTKWIWDWKWSQAGQYDGLWWEDLVEYLRPKMGEKLICIS